ncbi:MAG: hypothetical protein PVH88_07560 [Ignavibacteria bacterium]|jgi:hypothetical protein
MLKQKTNRLTPLSVCLLFVLLVSLCSSNFAQSGNFFWVDLGLGGGSVDEGGSFNFNAAYQFNENLLSLRALMCGKLFEGKCLNDYSLLYGRVLFSSTALFSVGGGIGIVTGKRSKGLFSEKKEIKTTIALPLETQLFWRPFRFLGLGLYGFANINSEESFAGGTFSLQVGLLR